MPALKKFDAKVARHVALINRNLCANLIRHDYIVTGSVKAKRAQAEIESFLARALHENKRLADKPLADRLEQIKALSFLEPADKTEIGLKVLEQLSERYVNRPRGFTRVIKLEPRLGEDKAPMSVLELVDLDFEIKFWYTAKIVARLELQKLPLDGMTAHNVKKLTAARLDGAARFRAAVDEAKREFFAVDGEDAVVDPETAENLKNKPSQRFYKQTADFAKSKKYRTKPREARPAAAVPPPPTV